jgi:hypothetical protein
MILPINACVYTYTRSSFVSTSYPTNIVSGQNWTLRCSHALVRKFVSGYCLLLWRSDLPHLCGKVNKHNCRIWRCENPHVVLEHERDTPKINVWFGLMKSRVIGPVFHEATLTSKNVPGHDWEFWCWPNPPRINVSASWRSHRLPQWSSRFLESNISWPVNRKRRAHCLASQVTWPHPIRLNFEGIREERLRQEGTQILQELRESTTNAGTRITPRNAGQNLPRDWTSFGRLPSNKGCTHWVVLTSHVILNRIVTIMYFVHWWTHVSSKLFFSWYLLTDKHLDLSWWQNTQSDWLRLDVRSFRGADCYFMVAKFRERLSVSKGKKTEVWCSEIWSREDKQCRG